MALADQHNQSTMAMKRSGRKLTQEDAIAFMNLIKATLSQQHMEKYQEFLNVMKDFKARRIDIVRLKDRVEKIFSRHSNLYFGFDAFLPAGYKFIDPNSRETAELEIGREFERKLLYRFKDRISVYISFRDLVDLCKARNTDMKHVRDEIVRLFRGHDDILNEFICFAPYIINTCLMDCS